SWGPWWVAAIAIGVLAATAVFWARFVSSLSDGFTLTSCGCTAPLPPTDAEVRALWSRHREELDRLQRMVVPGQPPRWLPSAALAPLRPRPGRLVHLAYRLLRPAQAAPSGA